MEYRLDIKVNSDKEHPPVIFSIRIPEQAALILMAMPVTSVGLSIGRSGSGEIGGLPLLDVTL